MKAIILAAGSGIRLKDNEEVIPTCLMKIGNETILERQINILKKEGVRNIIVIAGKEGACWTKENIDKISDIAGKVLINPLNNVTPSSSSLLIGLDYFSKPSTCLVIDGDLIFEKRIIKTMLEDNHKKVVLIERIKLSTKGNYVRVKERSEAKQTNGKHLPYDQRQWWGVETLSCFVADRR